MATIIDMPKLSDTMTVGTLVNWLKQEGDPVKSGDMLAEVETDKATMELENFEDGILLKQYVKVGEQVPIGAPIAAIGKKGETAPEAPTSIKQAKPVEKSGALLEQEPEAPAARPEAVTAPVSAAAPAGRIKASPLAKKIAASGNVSLEGIQGTGPGGRIVKADVLSAIGAAKSGISVPSMGQPIAKEASIPISNMRRAIATALVQSKTQIPHFYLNIDVDAGPLMELRTALNKNLGELPPEKGGLKLTVNDFILKATAEALRRVPQVNASWQGDSILQHGKINLAFGVAIEDGLVTPVICDAHAKTLRQISSEVKELVEKARKKKLAPDDMKGHTFTVTNLGMYGITSFYGIINPPNAGILSVGATIKTPVVDSHGNIVVGQRINIGFSGDHRVVDGVTGALFLAALKEIIETPALMFV
ncbi:MAG: dihydrolipoamide acetyltransferase [Verrucomicrobia bacterium]|nr:MAG: dihydrolipoamide acetyltransferase [Verrucomicrobiota bacterium]